jgi:phage gp36-like protein
MADPIITKDQMVARIGQVQFDRVFDDNNDGKGDKLSWEQTLRDASGKVRGGIGLVYDATKLTADLSDNLTCVTLDVAEAMATKRRPTILKGDWVEMMKDARASIKDLRDGIANLGITTEPEPAANHGVRMTSGNPAVPNCFPRKMSDDWGSF